MAGTHTLAVSRFDSGSLPNYRYYRECSCGWQCRLGSEVTADSQFKGHQLNNGYAEPTAEEIAEPKNTQDQLSSNGKSVNAFVFKPANIK